MNKSRKRVRFLLIIELALFFSFFSVPATAIADTAFWAGSEDTDDGHLIVSMVYDDSGSMEGKKGTYCNYTFQLFLSLFGENDELFITYMSKPNVSSNYSIHNNRQVRVDNLRVHENKIFTPISAVKTAYERLLNEDGGVNDTYWLIVLTDGLFYDDQKKVVSQDQLDRYIESYANATMQNGNKVNILYVGIGDEVMFPNVEKENVNILHTKEPEDILNVLDYCGEVFSECIKVDNVDFIRYSIKKNELHIESELPLQKVILIQHNTGEKEITVTGKDLQGTSLSQIEEVDIYHSYIDYDTGLKESLKGKVTYWEKEDDYILGGIDFTFGAGIEQDDLMIYVQPAIELNIEYYNAKNELVELNDCSLEDVLKAKLVVNRLDTGEKVAPSLVAKEYEGSILVTDSRKKMRLAEGNGSVLIDISMVNEGMIITGNLSFSEAYTYRKTEPVALYKSEIDSAKEFLFERTGMVGNKEGMTLAITRNEIPFSRKDMSTMTLRFNMDSLPPLFHITYEMKNDGTIEIIPDFGYDNLFGKLFVNWLCVWLIPTGNMELTIHTNDILGNIQLTDVVTIEMQQGSILLEAWYFLYPFLVIGLIVGFIVKNRFKEKQTIYYIKLMKKGETLVPEWNRWAHVPLLTVKIHGRRIKWNSCTLLPYFSNQKKCGELTVYAAMPFYKKGNAVLLSGKDWKYRKLKDLKTSKVNEIMIASKEVMFDTEEDEICNTVYLEAGEYIYVENKEHRYLYHLGRER
ncbi:MAG: hypothetical protein ACI4FZ_01935 [Lachnospiraceae bacterium]